jgi:hypothetical protein
VCVCVCQQRRREKVRGPGAEPTVTEKRCPTCALVKPAGAAKLLFLLQQSLNKKPSKT